MSYEQFVEKVAEILKNLVDGSIELTVHTAVKNNGYERKGIRFVEKGNNISPTIYLEEFYEKFNRGSSAERLAGQVLEMYRSVRLEHSWKGEIVQSYGAVKERIVYKLVNRRKNRELLKQVPYVAYLDLAVLFYVLVDIDIPEERMATMLICNEHLKWWQVTAEDIYQRAALNTEKLLPYEFSAMCLVVEEMLGEQNPEEEEWKRLREQENMYVLTNSIRNCGAAAVLYPGRLEMIGVYFKENYYILPSSVHEVIVIPESKALPIEDMNCIVREVNETHVQPEELLSDHVYYYDRERSRLFESLLS